jgi:hypothetical protein
MVCNVSKNLVFKNPKPFEAEGMIRQAEYGVEGFASTSDNNVSLNLGKIRYIPWFSHHAAYSSM